MVRVSTAVRLGVACLALFLGIAGACGPETDLWRINCRQSVRAFSRKLPEARALLDRSFHHRTRGPGP